GPDCWLPRFDCGDNVHPLPQLLSTDGRAASGLVRLEVTFGEGQEGRPIGAGSVSRVVGAKGNVAVHQASFDRGKFRGPKVLLAKEPIYCPPAHSAEKHPFGIDPTTFDFRLA